MSPTQWPRKAQDERDVFRAMREITDAFTKKDPTAYAALTADDTAHYGVWGDQHEDGLPQDRHRDPGDEAHRIQPL